KESVILLVLVSVWTLQAEPVDPEAVTQTQENFDLGKFMGKWYQAAVASTCPCYLKRKSKNPDMVPMVLQHVDAELNFTKTATSFRNGTCKQMTSHYSLTSTPGRFFHHVSRFGSDVDSFVVRTDYENVAVMLQLSTEKMSGNRSTNLILYSRKTEVTSDALDDFKKLVEEHGISADTIIVNKNNGSCSISSVVSEQRYKREAELGLDQPEGSGMDQTFFNGSEACKAAPDTGPCFGSFQNYFYNSSSMSCELFSYGGCLGNQNNFKDERDCLQRCRTEAVCHLPMLAQPCSGQPPIWAFDSSAGLCVPYKVGFCQNNANKFYSKAECEEYCGKTQDDGTEFLAAN
uniref:Protein AMBP n=1 Tax=Tetraodon nigroviridis TaxID=99883 RepID=H3D6Q0_TETNG